MACRHIIFYLELGFCQILHGVNNAWVHLQRLLKNRNRIDVLF